MLITYDGDTGRKQRRAIIYSDAWPKFHDEAGLAGRFAWEFAQRTLVTSGLANDPDKVLNTSEVAESAMIHMVAAGYGILIFYMATITTAFSFC